MDSLFQRRQADRFRVGAASNRNQRLHQGKTLKRVTGIAHRARKLASEIVFNERAGQCRATENDRPALGQPAGGKLLKVFFHHHG